MSVASEDNVYLLPPAQQQQYRFALLLRARRAVEKAWDAMTSAPRAAAAFLGRLQYQQQIRPALQWLQRLSASLGRLAQPFASRLGRDGLLAGVGLLLTSDRARAGLRQAAGLVRGAASWVVSRAGDLLKRGLSLLGPRGTALASAAGERLTTLRTKLAERIAPAFLVATVTARLLGGTSLLTRIVRGYAAHKVMRLLVPNRLLRLLAELLVLPVLADSRLVGLVRSLVGQAPVRAANLAQQTAEKSEVQQGPSKAAEAAAPTAAAPEDQPMEQGDAADLAAPAPSNRAERRAGRQQQARRHGPPAAA